YLNLRELEQAEADATEAIERDRKRPKAYSNRAAAYIRLRRYDAALDDLKKAISLNGKDPHFYSVRSYAYACKGDLDRAWEAQKIAEALDHSYKKKRDHLDRKKRAHLVDPPVKRPKKELSKEDRAKVALLLAQAEKAHQAGALKNVLSSAS